MRGNDNRWTPHLLRMNGPAVRRALTDLRGTGGTPGGNLPGTDWTCRIDRIGSWKLATPGKVNTPGTSNRRKGPAGDGTSPRAEVEGHATTGRAGASSETFGVLPDPAGGRRQTEQTSPETPAREEGDRGGGRLSAPLCLPVRRTQTGSGAQAGQRAVRRTTRAAAERPRDRANREARGAGALRWGGPGDRGFVASSAERICRTCLPAGR